MINALIVGVFGGLIIWSLIDIIGMIVTIVRHGRQKRLQQRVVEIRQQLHPEMSEERKALVRAGIVKPDGRIIINERTN